MALVSFILIRSSLAVDVFLNCSCASFDEDALLFVDGLQVADVVTSSFGSPIGDNEAFADSMDAFEVELEVLRISDSMYFSVSTPLNPLFLFSCLQKAQTLVK